MMSCFMIESDVKMKRLGELHGDDVWRVKRGTR